MSPQLGELQLGVVIADDEVDAALGPRVAQELAHADEELRVRGDDALHLAERHLAGDVPGVDALVARLQQVEGVAVEDQRHRQLGVGRLVVAEDEFGQKVGVREVISRAAGAHLDVAHDH